MCMYTREASSLDLFTDSVRIMGDATLCAVMEFDRRLDAHVLEDASRACLLAHPVLHSRLARGHGPAFWEMVDPGDAPILQVERSGGEYHPRVIGPVDPHRSPQFRVRLLRRRSGDVIVINLAHAAADAFGLHTLSSQLLQECREPGSIRRATGGIAERDTLWTGELYQGGGTSSDMKVINPLWPDPFGTSRQPSSFHRMVIDAPDLQAIHALAKSLGGSINDAVMAAYYLAMTDLTGHRKPIDLFFPVNLRQHLKDGSRVMSNQANNVCFTIGRGPDEGTEEILPRVIEETKLLKEGGIGIAEQVGMDRTCDPEGRRIQEMVEQMAALQKEGLADIFISNPGQFTLPDIEGLTDAYVCYPGGYMPTTCFMTSTFRGRMTVTMGYQDSRKPMQGTRTAMLLFRRHLLSIADGG
jgi:NRPS condensation-like uncharacterized protein